jgi:predicted esterase
MKLFFTFFFILFSFLACSSKNSTDPVPIPEAGTEQGATKQAGNPSHTPVVNVPPEDSPDPEETTDEIQDLPPVPIYKGKMPAPPKPFKIRVPEVPSSDFNNMNLAELPAEQLHSYVDRFTSQDRFEDAARMQYFFVEKEKVGLFDLASYVAMSPTRKEDALYWLQKAAEEEGGFYAQVEKNPYLKHLKADYRWDKIQEYLNQTVLYWKSLEVLQTVLVLPEGYTKETPLPLVIGLHGRGGNEHFFESEFQGIANFLKVGFLGVNGTDPLGKHSFSWSEHVTLDYQQIQKALESVKDRVRIDEKKLVLLGFAQGAQMAFEIAAHHQEIFLGAISIAPAPEEMPRNLKTIRYNRLGREQVFIFTAGNEQADRVQQSKANYEWAQFFKAKTKYFFYEKVTESILPPDYHEKVEKWIKEVLGR